MKKQIGIMVAAVAFVAGAAWAGEITEWQARTVAANFVAQDSIGQSVLAERTVDMVTRRGGLWLVTLKPSGYLMVSVNRAASPIVTFSECDFEEPAADSPMAAFLAAAETNAINATGAAYETQWRTMLGERMSRLATAGMKAAATAEYVNVAPMVSSSWSQGYPYNELTPIIDGSHTPVGCVATAYSQVLRFWEWPERLDEDITTEHTVDGMWGHTWRLKAGTVFDWDGMPYSGGYDNATRLKLGRGAMFAGMIARMTYNTKASGTQTSQPGKNRWYTEYRVLDTSNSTLAQREEGMKESLLNGCPFMVSVDYAGTGHAVVGDGWQENANGKYVHLNYGWGYNNSYYGTTTPLGVYLNQRPRPMVMNKPLPTKAKLPLTVEWSFPTKGYDTTLTGFEISYTEVADTAADWCDDMSGEGTGTIDGECLSVETVDATDHGNVMRIGTKADEATYTWPTMVATKDTVLSFDIHSWNALGMTAEVQLLDPSVGWITLTTPEISEKSEIAWTTHTFNLAEYAGKGIAVRVKATRSGSSSYNDDNSRATGVQFDNIRLTQVRQSTKAVIGTKTAAKADRSFSINDAALVADKTYLFQVTPTFNDNTIDGIPGYAASCTITATDSAKPTITSVESVSASAPQMQDGLFREGYFGLNQFGVYGSSAMTKLEAYLSNLAVIGEVEEQDATQPIGTMITVHDKVSITNAVKVAKKADGQFLVKVDVSKLTTYLNYTGMILTLVGRNDAGDAVQKDICLRFVRSGSETEIAAAELPEAGTISGGDSGDGGDTPAATSYTVSFATMGGTSVSQRTVASGKAVGVLPETTRDGYTFLGWFTEVSGGTEVTKDTVITGNVIYFAQWQENTPVVTTYTVTFDPNGGSPEMSRFVNENAAVGALPTTVTKSGYKLVGWFTAANGGTQIFASQTIIGNVTYYAHWEVAEGGGTGGGSADDGSTRFCHGVTKTSGAYDVTRSGAWNTITPISYNLIFWWVDRYYEANGSNPSDYTAPGTGSIPDNGSYTIPSYTAYLLNSALPQTLSAGANREPYFPSSAYTAAEWSGTATDDDRVKAAGKMIYAHLANGPIGVKVIYSLSRSYGAVIWGCDYATDGNDKYATAVYITDTTSSTRSDNAVTKRTLSICETYDGSFNGVGLKSFNTNDGVIDYYYPITEPAGSSQPDDPVVTTHTVTFDADGGTAVNAIAVADGSTISTLPTSVRSGYTFLGWFNGDEELTTATTISSDVTYTAHWQLKVVTPTHYTVVFNANGGTVSEVSREVACGTAVGELPVPTYSGHLFGGWYQGEAAVDAATVVADDVVYVAHWTVVDAGKDDPIGYADNDDNPGNNYTTAYQYEMYDNYYTARKRAIQQGKQLFILSGASWCSNCAFVKSYLTTLGSAFTDKFVVYYSNHDDDVSSPYFHGGLPQYGAADPRTTDAFTGTLDGTTRTWSSVWTTTGCGIYKQDRGGYAPERVDTVVAAGQAKAAYGYPTNLAVRGLATLAKGHAGQYELYAQFADGVEMPVDYGVTWTIVSGNGSLAEANVDGRKVTALTIASGDVILRATSTFYFTGTKTIIVKSTDLSNVASVAINTKSVNLEDDATPLIDAVATMNDGSKIAVVGFGDWSAKFKSRIARADTDLEEDNQSPTITFDPTTSRLTYAKTYGKLEVCDQKIDVTLSVNGKSVTQEVTVWGPTKVAPSQWKMISGPKQSALGVVRLQCTELKYNYGGKILTTKDTYFASYKTVLKQGSTTVDTSLRGLTAYAFSEQGGICTVGLSATKVNGKYTGYTPADPTTSELATNFTNVAKGTAVTDADKGSVPVGFFQAFFPTVASDTYATLADVDSDGDGFKNWEEYVLGTDPTDKADAFTLMQGYQHLAAPAADGATMQYKVMYAQRARRIYYIEAKQTWGDVWTPVATVSLANAAESDVTSFTALNADYADAAKFFRVRASLYEHVFNDPDNAPKITPNMLVAAPDAIIDLTGETLPLELSSFDTDATDPGTVYVKVPADVQAGAVLITAPAVAAKSMAALAPRNLADELKFVVQEAPDGKLALTVASSVMPAIEGGDEQGTVEVTDEKIVVTPADSVTEIVISNPGERQVEIPPSIERIGGVTDSTKIVIKGGNHDITKAMKFTFENGGFKVELDATAKVKVKGEDAVEEEISVQPEFASADDEKPFEVQDGELVFKVKSIPGLKYQVLASDSLESDSFEPTGQAREATGTRRELTLPRSSGCKGFYKIQVSR